MINVVIISHSLIPSVLLCGHSQLDYLKSIGKINYEFISVDNVTSYVLSKADIIIFIRSESRYERFIASICKKANKHLIYILDDDLLNIPDYLSSSAYYLRSDIQKNMRKIMADCDTFLTSSPVMLQKYGNRFKQAFQIHEPSLNAINKKEKNDIVKIGFAGSIDRAKDVENILKNTIKQLIDKYQDKISIEFFGAKPDLVDEYNLNYIPYQDSYQKYNDVIQERNWDIGLAPMPDSEFHNCKYFNKYVEYASYGIVGVYSNVKPYTFGIRNAYNGLLCDNDTQSWVEAISRLIEDEKLRKEMQNNCLKEANGIYSLKTLADDYLDKIMVGFDKDKPRTWVRGLWLTRIETTIRQLIYKLKEQKLYFPIWVVKKFFSVVKEKRSRTIQ